MRGRKRLGKVSDSQWMMRGVEEVGEVGGAWVVETKINGGEVDDFWNKEPKILGSKRGLSS